MLHLQGAFKKYIEDNKYNMEPIVAFSGDVSIDDKEYTESKINGFSEKELPVQFNKDSYHFLIVANKYQTGFDQPKLCAMYIMKKLDGVNAVQTLSRLNRTCLPFDKTTFILDFKNSYKDIKNAFSVYYDKTVLSETVNPKGIKDINNEIDGYGVIHSDDVNAVNDFFYKNELTFEDKQKVISIFQRSKKRLEDYSIDEQNEFILKMRSFVRLYEFLLQATNFEDIELHKKYNFILYFSSYVSIKRPGNGFNLEGKITASNFSQRETGAYKKDKQKSNPFIKTLTTGTGRMNEDKESKLSEILDDINARTGKKFNNDTIKSVDVILNLLMESEELKVAARNNTEPDFEFKFWEVLSDLLIDNLDEDEEFFSLLLNNDEMRKEVFGIYVNDIYVILRDEN